MPIDLDRTFSVPRDSPEDMQDWSAYFKLERDRGDYDWSDLHQEPVTVVVGEAGIGKTVEFQNEVARLDREGKSAFFIPLNQICDREAWNLLLESKSSNYALWQQNSDIGYFFFDAVDEARLISHAVYEKALLLIQTGLRDQMARVRVVISSRITDWTVPAVKETIQRYLVAPINAALQPSQVKSEITGSSEVVHVTQRHATKPIEPLVVSLDPLSRSDAKNLAVFFKIEDEDSFWSEVTDGGYEFMATRPLDLEWMVKLWNKNRTLGTYLQLIEGNIANRLGIL